MRTTFAFFAAVLGGFSFLVAIAACGDERPDGAVLGGASGPIPGTVGTSQPPSTLADSGSAFDDSLCETVPLGDPVAQIERFGDVPFAPRGGAPRPGKFMLMEYFVYTTSPTEEPGEEPPGERLTDVVKTKTIFVEGGAISIASAEGDTESGVGPTTVLAGTYTTSGTNLVIEPSCPAGVETTIGFTASETGLVLFVPNGEVEVYRRLD